jgi:hypothetical protein
MNYLILVFLSFQEEEVKLFNFARGLIKRNRIGSQTDKLVLNNNFCGDFFLFSFWDCPEMIDKVLIFFFKFSIGNYMIR